MTYSIGQYRWVLYITGRYKNFMSADVFSCSTAHAAHRLSRSVQIQPTATTSGRMKPYRSTVPRILVCYRRTRFPVDYILKGETTSVAISEYGAHPSKKQSGQRSEIKAWIFARLPRSSLTACRFRLWTSSSTPHAVRFARRFNGGPTSREDREHYALPFGLCTCTSACIHTHVSVRRRPPA